MISNRSRGKKGVIDKLKSGSYRGGAPCDLTDGFFPVIKPKKSKYGHLKGHYLFRIRKKDDLIGNWHFAPEGISIQRYVLNHYHKLTKQSKQRHYSKQD